MNVKIINLVFVFFLVIAVFSFGVIAQELIKVNAGNTEVVGVLEKTVCCEKTNSGLYCQDVPEDECAVNPIPTSCESTALCSGGYCFDSTEGTCSPNTAQLVCDDNGGVWSADFPAQCGLGCCTLGDEASFVTLTRCIKMASDYGLETQFNPDIISEPQCILSTKAEEKGACVFEKNFQNTCKFVKRSECTVENILNGGSATNNSAEKVGGLVPAEKIVNKNNSGTGDAGKNNSGITGQEINVPTGNDVEFHPNVLCSSEELGGVICGPSKKTTCLPGREEVYFVDTCGNPANIYDASKVNDKNYWSNVIDKSEACSADGSNENSQSCGNCNYLLGSYCRETSSETANPTYGENICASLNCIDSEGNKRLHGESWCIKDDTNLVSAITGSSVGSRQYRNVCINGEVSTESCADFRNEECIQDTVETSLGDFTQAACRVNRWQDCTAQTNKDDCLNGDKRDCKWLEGIGYILMGNILGGGDKSSDASATLEANSVTGIKDRAKQYLNDGKDVPTGACVPEISPGLEFWKSGEETSGDAFSVCAQANAICPVTYEKGLVGSGWKPVKNKECLPGGKLEAQRIQLCAAIGDCGLKTNFIGQMGSGKGYKVSKEKTSGNKGGGGNGK